MIRKRKYLGEFGTIKYIALDPEYQGKGYSKELLNKVENELYKAGIKEWRESTDEKNVSMIKAFLSQGLKKKRELFYYIYNPEVAFKKFI